jgi:nitrite reductase/ring-hydroxylating ferredoxin subunit
MVLALFGNPVSIRSKRGATVLKKKDVIVTFRDLCPHEGGEGGLKRARQAAVRSPDSVHRACPLYVSTVRC